MKSKNCRKCAPNKCKCPGATGPQGPTGPTGPAGITPFAPSLLDVYVLGSDDVTVLAGQNVIFPNIAVGPVSPAFSYNALTGVVTFTQAGVFEVIYGVSSPPSDSNPVQFAAVVDPGAIIQPQSRYVRLLGGDTDLVTVAFMITVTAGQSLHIQNVGASATPLSAGDDLSLVAFMTVKRVG